MLHCIHVSIFSFPPHDITTWNSLAILLSVCYYPLVWVTVKMLRYTWSVCLHKKGEETNLEMQTTSRCLLQLDYVPSFSKKKWRVNNPIYTRFFSRWILVKENASLSTIMFSRQGFSCHSLQKTWAEWLRTVNKNRHIHTHSLTPLTGTLILDPVFSYINLSSMSSEKRGTDLHPNEFFLIYKRVSEIVFCLELVWVRLFCMWLLTTRMCVCLGEERAWCAHIHTHTHA